MAKTNQPKPVLSFSSATFLEIKFPIKIPIIDAKVKINKAFNEPNWPAVGSNVRGFVAPSAKDPNSEMP